MTVNRNNYEEYFLLYIDRELNGNDTQMVEEFVRRHPDLEKELTALKQTVAVPPEIVFEHKEILLRDEKERRLFPVYLWRIAAALLIVLAGTWFLVMTGKLRKPGHPAADSREMTIKMDAKNKRTAAEIKTENTQNAASVKKTDADSLHAGNLRKTRMAVVRQQPGSDLLSPDSNPIQQKLNTAKQNGSNPVGKANPDPANDFPQAALSANQDIRQPSMDLPEIAQNKMLPEIIMPSSIRSGGQRSPLSTVNRQPSTNQPSSSSQSILVFDNKNRTVSGFFKKMMSASPEDATADNRRQKIRVSVFQFNLKK